MYEEWMSDMKDIWEEFTKLCGGRVVTMCLIGSIWIFRIHKAE